MHKVTFYPLGNADTCLIELDCGAKLLFDYANKATDDEDDKRIGLEEALRSVLEESEIDFFDAVAFTHLHEDHIQGASDFFYLEHAKKYQGEGRVKIATLYVPAAVIIEDGCKNEERIIQAEARYRLIEGEGIRVFSRPAKLEEWLGNHGLSLDDRAHLITDAGQLAPEFTIDDHGVEFFVHSPFASRLEDGTLIDRNIDSLAMQATFVIEDLETKLFLTSDIYHESLTAIARITKYHNNESRLEWDIFNTPHHCSYRSLAPEKGESKTTPVPEVKWLLEEQSQQGAVIVSTSKPIPNNDNDDQPPHRQAANYYKDAVAKVDGEFLVTMEHPNSTSPEPLAIEIDGRGATVKRTIMAAAIRAVSSSAPRAG